MTRDERSSNIDASQFCIGMVVSTYHESITSKLRDGAIRAFIDCGGNQSCLQIVPSPGAFELIAISHQLVESGAVDAVVALGCVIKGETTHDQHICQAIANGLATMNATAVTPVTFGVLTCESMEQAHARAGGAHGNKGTEAMLAAIAAATTMQSIRTSRSCV